MENSKTYEVIKPALNLTILRAKLTDTGIDTSLSKDGITYTPTGSYSYTEISRINISLIDYNRNQISIAFHSGKKLKLISLSLGKLSEVKIRRDTVDQTTEFNNWVAELHAILIRKKLSDQIQFSEGSTAKTFLLILLLAACVAGIILAISINRIGLAGALVTGVIAISTIIFKIGLKKKYNPESKVFN